MPEQPGALMEIELWSSNGTFTLQKYNWLNSDSWHHDESHHFQAKGTLYDINRALSELYYR